MLPEDSMSKSRRHYSDEFKADVVRRHLAGKVPVSDLAAEFQLQPSMIHLWIKQVLDQAERAFQRSKGGGKNSREDLKARRIAHLEEKLANKNEVIAELMEENVKAKKANGEL
jgi:transposase-like protein